MIQLPTELVIRVVDKLPGEVRRMLHFSGLFLAGGFIRSVIEGEKPKDVDIWGPSREILEKYAGLLAGAIRKGMFSTPNAISINFPNLPVQFITRWLFSSPEILIETFDFTIAQAVVWFDRGEYRWKGLCADTFLLDVGGKQLVYTSPNREEDAAGSLLRVNRFLKRGYSISDEDLAKVIARVGVAVLKEPVNSDPVEPYRRVIKAARPRGGGSV